MKRNIKKVSTTDYDIIVIGSGIQGAAIAYEATLRGQKVCLLEIDDFVSKTSFNSLKIIHGGLRYLQKADLIRMRESIIERRTLLKIAPHLVSPLKCVMPTTPIWKLKSKYAMTFALLFNDIIGFDRNEGLTSDKNIARGKIISKKNMMDILGDNTLAETPTGGAVWYDAMVHNSERLVLSYIHSGTKLGMDALNYCEIKDFTKKDKNISSLTVKDLLTKEIFSINCKFLINSSGASLKKVSSMFSLNDENHFTPVRVMNLVTKRKLFPTEYAVGIFGKSRAFFFVPWREYFMIGSSEKNWDGNVDDFNITQSDINEFLDEINEACPKMKLKIEEISFVHKGLLPSKKTTANGLRSPADKFIINDHSKYGKINNMFSVIPVKYTTARDVAKKVINLFFKRTNKAFVPSKSSSLSLYGGDTGNFSKFYLKVSKTLLEKTPMDESRIRHLLSNYGSAYNEILKYAEENKELYECVPGSNEVTKAELMFAIKNEMAISLNDVMLRRTDLGTGEKPKEETIAYVTSFLKQILDWDNNKLLAEINSLNEEYSKLML